MPTTLQLYRNLIKDHEYPFCWACGRTGDYCDHPDRWFGDWWIDRSHIVNKPRVEDRRLVVLLCRLCHFRFSGGRISSCRGHQWPKLTVAHLVWLKKTFDPSHYDRAFLQAHSVGRLPVARELPAVYREEYGRRHPE